MRIFFMRRISFSHIDLLGEKLIANYIRGLDRYYLFRYQKNSKPYNQKLDRKILDVALLTFLGDREFIRIKYANKKI